MGQAQNLTVRLKPCVYAAAAQSAPLKTEYGFNIKKKYNKIRFSRNHVKSSKSNLLVIDNG